jgi:hypothetical protein
MAPTFGKIVPKYGAQHKSRTLKYIVKFNTSVGETEQHLFHYLLYAASLAHCANWLVYRTPRVNHTKLLP